MTSTTGPPHVGAAEAPRPATPPRMCVLDLDGTVLDLEQHLHPRTRAAVRAAVEAGVVVVAASGRMYRSALPWARELGLLAPLICYQGALVCALPDANAPRREGVPQGRLLTEDPLRGEVALRGLEVARRGGWHRQAYREDVLLCEERRPEADLYATIAQVGYTLVDDLAPLIADGTTKLVCVVDDAVGAAACEVALRDALAGAARVVRSLPQFVEVTDPSATKGRALRRLCTLLDIAPAEVVAVGDAPNDIDMLQTAGLGVAVESAHPDLIAVADAVCAPPEQAGVADVLEWLELAPAQPG